MRATIDSATDPLTGAWTRAALDRALERVDGTSLPLTLCLIDLDHFKSVNDAFGHLRGDRSLAELGTRIGRSIREGDLLFRYGGDEFVLLLPRTDTDVAERIAARILDAVCAQPFSGDPPLHLTLSIGVATASGELGNLLASADSRLYEAKRRGRGRVVAKDPATPRALGVEEGGRLLEREEALERLLQFLERPGDQRCGALAVQGEQGSGRSRFLTEAGALAERLNYAVVALVARSALRRHLYGALGQARSRWLAPPPAGAHWGANDIRSAVAAAGMRGLVITVDDLQDLDHASIALLRQLLEEQSDQRVALIYSSRASSAAAAVLDTARRTTITLLPLSLTATGIWLRGALAWEAPHALVAWLHEETGGKPGTLLRAVSWLVEQGVIVPALSGWSVSGKLAKLHLPAAFRAAHCGPIRLPDTEEEFVGRLREIQELKDLLDSGGLVSLVGPGGVGKTRLAIQAAAELAHGFRDGVAFVSLAGVEDPEHIPARIAEALELTTSHSGPGATLLAALADCDLLLILDNVEHGLGGAAALAALRAGAPGVRLLITARQPPQVPGECVVLVHGLGVGMGVGVGDGTAGWDGEAVQLFAVLAGRRGHDWHLEDERAYVGRICKAVGGMPLGIALAAAWVPLLGCAAIADELDASQDLLGNGPEHGAQAALAYFWGILSPEEQRTLRSLGLFRDGFTRDAAQAVAGASLLLLSALVDRAFLSKDPLGRYHLHEFLRGYCMERLARHPEEHLVARGRHATHFLGLAEQARPHLNGAEQQRWRARLGAEHASIWAALGWCTQPGAETAPPEAALRFACALWPYWLDSGHLTEGRTWLQQVLAMGGGDTVLRMRALRAASVFAWQQCDTQQAQDLAERALRLADDMGDLEVRGAAHNILGLVALCIGDDDAAVEHYTEALALHRERGDLPEVGTLLNNLGNVAMFQGDLPRAQRFLDESLATMRAAHDSRGATLPLANLTQVAYYQGDLPRARHLAEEALALGRENKDQVIVAWVRHLQGRIAHKGGDLARAEALLVESLEAMLRLDCKGDAIAAMEALAVTLAARGLDNARRAAALLGSTAALRVALRMPLPQSELATIEAVTARVTASLDAPTFAHAWAEGQGRSFAGAVTEAIRGYTG